MADPRYTASGSFRVRPHRPWRTAVIAVVVVLGLGAGGWSLYRLGLAHGGHAHRMARATESHLRIQIEELRERVSELAERNTLLERSERIERQARERLRGVLEAREERIAELQKELSFYRNLVSPSEMEPGIQIRRLAVEAVPGATGLVRYEVILAQLNGSDRYVSGRIDLKLEGRRGDAQATLGLRELVTDEEPETYFRFKYFQSLTGQIRLPKDFEPARVELRVRPEGDRLEGVDKGFSWDSVFSGGT